MCSSDLKIGFVDFVAYLIAQFAGAIAGAGLVKLVCSQMGYAEMTLGSNSINGHLWGALIVETVLTFIFVFVILGVTSDPSKGGIAGLVIGLTLTFVHIVGIPLTGTSVNPARSFGPALLVGGDSLKEVWVFIAAPLVGAVLAALVFMLIRKKEAE